MLSPYKLLKIVLPLTTATTATIVTASLVAFKKEKLEKSKASEEILLNSFEIEKEEFKDEIIRYSEEVTKASSEENNKELKDDLKQKVESEFKSETSLVEVLDKAKEQFERMASRTDINGEKELNLKAEELITSQASKGTEKNGVEGRNQSSSLDSLEEEISFAGEEQSMIEEKREDGLTSSSKPESQINNEQTLATHSNLVEETAKQLKAEKEQETEVLTATTLSNPQDMQSLENQKGINSYMGEGEIKRLSEIESEDNSNSESQKMKEEDLAKLESLNRELLGFKNSLEVLLSDFN